MRCGADRAGDREQSTRRDVDCAAACASGDAAGRDGEGVGIDQGDGIAADYRDGGEVVVVVERDVAGARRDGGGTGDADSANVGDCAASGEVEGAADRGGVENDAVAVAQVDVVGSGDQHGCEIVTGLGQGDVLAGGVECGGAGDDQRGRCGLADCARGRDVECAVDRGSAKCELH